MDAASLTALALLVLAVIFWLSEALLGSDGSLLLLGVICLLAGAVFGWRAWWPAGPAVWWVYVVGIGLALPFLISVGAYVFPRTVVGQNLLGDPEDPLPFAADTDHGVQWIGRQGRTLTPMNPGGMVLIDGARCHAETEGFMLEPDRPIQVVDVRGNRLVVREIDA